MVSNHSSDSASPSRRHLLGLGIGVVGLAQGGLTNAAASPRSGREGPSREGDISVPGGRVRYRIVGDGPGVPLLVLHGGPGAGWDYLEPLGALGSARPVVLYDQLGCGRSDKPDDTSLWQLDRFVEELAVVRRALGLDRIHLLGHSWGGFLAIEYLLGQPKGVASAVLASTSASTPQFVDGTKRLRATLPADVQATLDRYEAAGDFAAPEYLAAVNEFYIRFLCRLDPYPEPLLRSIANLDGNQVYLTMNGPNEFVVTGNYRDWERRGRLGEIRLPVLATHGRYDEFTQDCLVTLERGIPGARRTRFETSSHMSHLEQTSEYLNVLRSFLARHDCR